MSCSGPAVDLAVDLSGVEKLRSRLKNCRYPNGLRGRKMGMG